MTSYNLISATPAGNDTQNQSEELGSGWVHVSVMSGLSGLQQEVRKNRPQLDADIVGDSLKKIEEFKNRISGQWILQKTEFRRSEIFGDLTKRFKNIHALLTKSEELAKGSILRQINMLTETIEDISRQLDELAGRLLNRSPDSKFPILHIDEFVSECERLIDQKIANVSVAPVVNDSLAKIEAVLSPKLPEKQPKTTDVLVVIPKLPTFAASSIIVESFNEDGTERIRDNHNGKQSESIQPILADNLDLNDTVRQDPREEPKERVGLKERASIASCEEQILQIFDNHESISRHKKTLTNAFDGSANTSMKADSKRGSFLARSRQPSDSHKQNSGRNFEAEYNAKVERILTFKNGKPEADNQNFFVRQSIRPPQPHKSHHASLFQGNPPLPAQPKTSLNIYQSPLKESNLNELKTQQQIRPSIRPKVPSSFKTDCDYEIDLSRSSLTDDRLPEIVAAIFNNNTAKVINFAYNSITTKGAEFVINCLMSHPTIHTLNFSANPLSDSFFDVLTTRHNLGSLTVTKFVIKEASGFRNLAEIKRKITQLRKKGINIEF